MTTEETKQIAVKTETETPDIKVIIANHSHIQYVQTILDTIEAAAKVRGTGIAKRSPEYVEQKIREGKSIIALCGDEFAGFCYIESWGNKQFVANSGLIVAEKFRQHGLAKRIKRYAFSLARTMFPEAKVFGLTSGAAVMKINTELGYNPVTFSQLTDDESFWKGCQGCVNYDVLTRTERRYCICTAMLFDPAQHKDKKEVKDTIKELKKQLKQK
ncbi:MAG: acetyltransferase [Bacteroidetes bacterium]|nr:acetyltransferase [Bacteroidota bacterium]